MEPAGTRPMGSAWLRVLDRPAFMLPRATRVVDCVVHAYAVAREVLRVLLSYGQPP